MFAGYDWSWCYIRFGPVIDGPNYTVSHTGDIWSKFTSKWVKSTVKPRKKCGYRFVWLSVGADGENREITKAVHSLVLEAFVGKCPAGMECRHLNGNQGDNHLDNLRWGTCLENVQDRIEHGTVAKGSRVANSKLTEADIPIILEMHNQGIATQIIADRFRVTFGAIWFVIRGKSWRHCVPSDQERRMP